MKSNFNKSLTYLRLLFIFTIFSGCTSYENVIPKPEIVVDLQDRWNEGFFGYVRGVDANLYILAIYANINNKWYNLPDRLNPTTTILQDGSWTCGAELEPTDNVFELAIYLLPKGYLPPIMEGESSIPLKLNLVSPVKKKIVF